MNDSQVAVFIEGETIDIVPLNSENINLYVKWENDPTVRIYARNIIPNTIEDMKKRLEPPEHRMMKKEINFEVWHKKDKIPIGHGEIADIDWYGQIGWLGLIIGEPKYWGQKIGEEVTRLMVEYAFNELNLYKIYAGINSANIGSWRCAERNGLTREAILKKAQYVNGKYHDLLIYSLFKEDWLKLRKK
jgi:RimJ/RimL family protein N-acetyltransferase